MDPAAQLSTSFSNARPPPATNLAHLPPKALGNILGRAGPHVRLVCRAFRTLHPPLLSLAPNSISTTGALTAALSSLSPNVTSLNFRSVDSPFLQAPASCIATVGAAASNLQSLTLPWEWHEHCFPLLVNALPHLPHLHTLHTAPHDFGHSPANLPRLPLPHPAPSWSTLLRPPLATRLRSLALPLESLPTFYALPPAALPHLTHLHTHHDCWWGELPIRGAHLASLAAAAPTLQSLAITPRFSLLMSPTHFTALATLTALHLNGVTCGRLEAIRLLRPLATLTALCSLNLVFFNSSWSPEAAACLTQLTRLTKLTIALAYDGLADHQGCCFDDDESGDEDEDEMDDHCGYISTQRLALLFPQGGVPEQWCRGYNGYGQETFAPLCVIWAAGRLPQLLDLDFSLYPPDDELSYGEPASLHYLLPGTAGSFLRHLAAATQLRRLRLCNLTLPRAEAPLLSHLGCLTSLDVSGCQVEELRRGMPAAVLWDLVSVPATVNVLAMAARQFAGRGSSGASAPDHSGAPLPVLGLGASAASLVAAAMPGLARLTKLHTLMLSGLSGSEVQWAGPLQDALVGLQGQLVRLQLCVASEYGRAPSAGEVAVFEAIGGMRCLQVLDLYQWQEVMRVFAAAPASMRLPSSLRRCYLPREAGQEAQVLAQLRARHPLVDFRLEEKRFFGEAW